MDQDLEQAQEQLRQTAEEFLKLTGEAVELELWNEKLTRRNQELQIKTNAAELQVERRRLNKEKKKKQTKKKQQKQATKDAYSSPVQAVSTVAVWKDPAPCNAQTMTRNKLRNFTRKKKAWAEYEIGDRYYWGLGGLHQSYEEAVKWFEKAARQGHAKAQYDMGVIYDLGTGGVPQSDQKAIEYFELSARQGFAGAEYNLGIMFYYGQGVEKDTNTAREWLTRAAEHGHEKAIKIIRQLVEKEERELKHIETTNKKEPIDEKEREKEDEKKEKKKKEEGEEMETISQPDIIITTTTTTPLPIVTTRTPRSWFCEWCFKEHTTKHILLGCTRCNLVAYCDEECQKIHWMRHRPNCVEDYWKANDIKISISTLVAYDHAALMDQEDKYRHGVDCFMVVDQIKLNKKKREEEEDAGSENNVEEEKKKRQ